MWRLPRFGLLVVITAALSAACLHPMPPPGPPEPVPGVDAGAVDAPNAAADIFPKGILLDCSLAMDLRPADPVRTCLDVINTSGCLSDVVHRLSVDSPNGVMDSVGCTVRDFSMRLHVEIDKCTATDAQVQEANAADHWLIEHGIGFYAE